MKLVMLSVFDISEAMFQLSKTELCWADQMFAKTTGCTWKIWTNKDQPKKVSHRMAQIDGMANGAKELSLLQFSLERDTEMLLMLFLTSLLPET